MSEDAIPPLPDLEHLLDESGRYDLWHTHLDWRGEGNSSPEARAYFLRGHFRLFEEIQQRTGHWSRPVQIWMVIEETDSSQDAVYIHTPNPNRDNFPYPFTGVVWGANLPPWLEKFVDRQRHEAGRCEFNGVVSFWIRRRRQT